MNNPEQEDIQEIDQQKENDGQDGTESQKPESS